MTETGRDIPIVIVNWMRRSIGTPINQIGPTDLLYKYTKTMMIGIEKRKWTPWEKTFAKMR
jgi:hypothetical protein